MSGAEQLKISDAHGEYPIISAHIPYSTLDKPGPNKRRRSASERAHTCTTLLMCFDKSEEIQRFHNPSDCASAFKDSCIGWIVHRSPEDAWALRIASDGKTHVLINALSFPRMISASSLISPPKYKWGNSKCLVNPSVTLMSDRAVSTSASRLPMVAN